MLSRMAAIAALILLCLAASPAPAQERNVIFFGHHDLGCEGQLTVNCVDVGTSILDPESKLSFNCIALHPTATWEPSAGANPFRVKSVNIDAVCWKFQLNDMSAAAVGSAQPVEYPHTGTKNPAPFVWLYDKATKSVSVCFAGSGQAGNGWFEPACERATIKE